MIRHAIEESPRSADSGEAPDSRGATHEPIYDAMTESLPQPPPIYQPAVQLGPPSMGEASGPLPPSSAPSGAADDGLGQPVFLTFDDLAAVLGKMRELLPPDARFSFNHDSEKAWIVAANGVDLHVLVEQAMNELGRTLAAPAAPEQIAAVEQSVAGA
jgi:hypothetical protein